MARAVPEWIGRTPDTAIPQRVRDRVSRAAGDCCQHCRRAIMGKLRGEIDHITPLILGGQHRESNLQLLCHECHGAKTALDVKLKAKVARVRAKHFGAPAPRQRMVSRGFRKAPPQHSATRPIERRVPE